MERLGYEFYARPCLEVARDLVGKVLIHQGQQLRISETEAYWGIGDTACHASKGRTKRTEVLWEAPGTVYVYLCYGVHWMMNVITGEKEDPQGVLIRACVDAEGPGKLTKKLGITGSRNREDAVISETIWIADEGFHCDVVTDKRVGIGYASQEDQDKLWRFKMAK